MSVSIFVIESIFMKRNIAIGKITTSLYFAFLAKLASPESTAAIVLVANNSAAIMRIAIANNAYHRGPMLSVGHVDWLVIDCALRYELSGKKTVNENNATSETKHITLYLTNVLMYWGLCEILGNLSTNNEKISNTIKDNSESPSPLKNVIHAPPFIAFTPALYLAISECVRSFVNTAIKRSNIINARKISGNKLCTDFNHFPFLVYPAGADSPIIKILPAPQ